jgi:hypothetical protein
MLFAKSRMARSFCNDVRALGPALWAFVTVAGGEMANHAGERALCPAVLWREGCFGTDSSRGNTFVAKIVTATATCRLQHRHPWPYLTDAVRAYCVGKPAPSLLPV